MRKQVLLLVFLLMSGLCFGQIKATSTTSHSVTLQGCSDTVSGVMFNFYRGTSPSGENLTTPLNSTPQGTCYWLDTTVQAATTYYYVVEAYCGTCSPQSSGPSSEVQAVVPANAAPPPPTGLTVGTVAVNSVPLFWLQPATPPAGYTFANYRVYRGSLPTLPNPSWIGNTTSLSFIDKKCSGTCYYEVRALYKWSGEKVLSAPSNIVSAID